MILCMLSIAVLTKAALAEIGALHPDVKFGENNDRFDLTDLIDDTNRMYSQNHLVEEDDEDFRRQIKSDENGIKIIDILNHPKNSQTISGRKSMGDIFAYDDKMNSNEGGTVQDYEQNLKHFMSDANLRTWGGRRMGEYVRHLHKDQPNSRRSAGSYNERDVLMHYAVPVSMNIDGYLRVPIH